MTRATWNRVSPTARMMANCRTRSLTPMLSVVKMMNSAARSDMPVAAHACRRALVAIVASAIAFWMSCTPTKSTGGLVCKTCGSQRARNAAACSPGRSLMFTRLILPACRVIFSARANGTYSAEAAGPSGEPAPP